MKENFAEDEPEPEDDVDMWAPDAELDEPIRALLIRIGSTIRKTIAGTPMDHTLPECPDNFWEFVNLPESFRQIANAIRATPEDDTSMPRTEPVCILLDNFWPVCRRCVHQFFVASAERTTMCLDPHARHHLWMTLSSRSWLVEDS
jgi:hypothetical protein